MQRSISHARSRWLVPIGFAFLMVSVAWAGPAVGQVAGTGAMEFRILDPDGVPLPGVQVVVEGPLGTNTYYAGVDGSARALGLAPGLYDATFTLDGFSTVVREGLRVSVGRTISVTVNMELSSVQETITVTGESPVVDVKSTQVGSLYTDDLINMTPTASGIWAGVLDHVPGVVTSNYDVGGGESGQQSGFRAFGSVGSSNEYKINGVPTTDPVATSSSAMAYVSVGSFEEVAVETAAHDIEMQGPGVMLNMVVKSGSNDWRAATKMFYSSEGMVSNNIDSDLEAEGVTAGTPNTFLRDLDFQGGGPIVRDRAWFFVDYWNFKVEKLVVGVPETDPDDTSLSDWTLNSTVQINNDHKASVRYLTGRKFRSNRGASNSTPPERARNQDSFKDVPQLEWQAVWGESTFSTIRYAKLDLDFPLVARNPMDNPAGVPGRQAAKEPHPDFLDQPITCDRDDTGLLYPANPNVTCIGWPSETNNLRDRTDINGTVSHYIAGDNSSHDLKIGADFGDFQEFVPRNLAFGLRQEYDTINGVPLTPSRVRLYNTNPANMFTVEQPNGELNRGRQYSLYAQDTWTFRNRMTVTGGIRWDWSKAWFPDQVRQESYWPELGPDFQEAIIPALENEPVWSNIVPRIGVVYDLFGDGRTALKANYARYSEWQATTYAGAQNPSGTGSYYYNWVDTNGDKQFQLGEQTTLRSTSLPGVTFQYDPDLKSPLTDEFTAGVEHELADNFLVSGMYIHRNRINNIEEINIGEPYGPIAATLGVPDEWIPTQVQDPGPDGVYGTADDGGFLTAYGHSLPLENQYLVTNPEKFGFNQDWSYGGFELSFQKRWSNNWQMLASYNVGEALIFDDVGDNPNRDIGRNGVRSSYDRPHLFKFTGNYLFAEPIGVNLGAFLRVDSGQGRIRSYNFRRSDWPDLEQGNTTIRVAPRREDEIGPKAYDWIKIVDIRAEKQFTIGRYGVLHAYLDVFNLFNANNVTSASGTSGPNFNNINDILPPRMIRVGAAWDF